MENGCGGFTIKKECQTCSNYSGMRIDFAKLEEKDLRKLDIAIED